ncbi:hypothetical protein [Methylobrevis pamukkalensis]|uniref:Uncharacterized protein n=1 Tax=Methylobrevis pamukkalensis TaxID=1439726 RepID=A0A1E3H4F0_9HYPH|nr:hypothetical protein [Methylobrevis pamukkalensis]ODN71192.1 hypothetical protein A6302_01481 [Methylobrevis pamukkalensis]
MRRLTLLSLLFLAGLCFGGLLFAVAGAPPLLGAALMGALLPALAIAPEGPVGALLTIGGVGATCVCLVVFADPAAAATLPGPEAMAPIGVAVAPAAMALPPILHELGGLAYELVVAIVIPALLYRWTGLKFKDSRRSILHSAATTGVAEALIRLGLTPGTVKPDHVANILSIAEGWIGGPGAGDTVKALGLDSADVQRIAAAKLAALIGATPIHQETEVTHVIAAPQPSRRT